MDNVQQIHAWFLISVQPMLDVLMESVSLPKYVENLLTHALQIRNVLTANVWKIFALVKYVLLGNVLMENVLLLQTIHVKEFNVQKDIYASLEGVYLLHNNKDVQWIVIVPLKKYVLVVFVNVSPVSSIFNALAQNVEMDTATMLRMIENKPLLFY